MKKQKITQGKKRILIIANSNMSNSGVPKVYMTIVRQLSSKYIFDLVIYSEDDMYYKDEFLSYGGRIYLLNQTSPKHSLLKIYWFLRGRKKQIDNYMSHTIDISSYYAVHSFDENFSWVFFKKARKKGVKYLIVHLCSAYLNYKQKFTIKRMLVNHFFKKSLKACTSIACCSLAVLQRHNYKNKGVVLRRTYNENNYSNIINCQATHLSLTQIGTFSNRKNQLFSIELLSKIKPMFPDAVLYFVGKELETGYESKMIKLIHKLHLENNVLFLGTSPDKNELYRNTTFVIHPALMEGFNNVLLEAQAVGIHCFASSLLPREPELGNADFLELDISIWARRINEYYNKVGGGRKKPTNLSEYSTTSFKSTVEKMMC